MSHTGAYFARKACVRGVTHSPDCVAASYGRQDDEKESVPTLQGQVDGAAASSNTHGLIRSSDPYNFTGGLDERAGKSWYDIRSGPRPSLCLRWAAFWKMRDRQRIKGDSGAVRNDNVCFNPLTSAAFWFMRRRPARVDGLNPRHVMVYWRPTFAQFDRRKKHLRMPPVRWR